MATFAHTATHSIADLLEPRNGARMAGNAALEVRKRSKLGLFVSGILIGLLAGMVASVASPGPSREASFVTRSWITRTAHSGIDRASLWLYKIAGGTRS